MNGKKCEPLIGDSVEKLASLKTGQFYYVVVDL